MKKAPVCRRPARLPLRPRKAVEHLRAADPALGKAIDLVGPFSMPAREANLHMLCASVIGQSISIRAAERIVARFSQVVGEPDALTPEAVLARSVEELRELGVTRGKAAAIRSLAELWEREKWTPVVVRDLPDAVLMERLTAIKGIGPWTAKMFLIFGLRRPDVLPEEDLGLRDALAQLRQLPERPSQRETVELCACWRPWRTVGTVYAWQYLLKRRGTTLETAYGWW